MGSGLCNFLLLLSCCILLEIVAHLKESVRTADDAIDFVPRSSDVATGIVHLIVVVPARTHRRTLHVISSYISHDEEGLGIVFAIGDSTL